MTSTTTHTDRGNFKQQSQGSNAATGASEVRKAAHDAVEAGKEAFEGAKHMAQEGYEGARELAKEGYEGAKHMAKEGYEGAKQASCDATDSVKQYITRYPLASIGMAAGVGLLLGCVAGWRMRS
jgi:ElaB/YqjD/DUF883 family membrane-anchored ribosome-binding protein